MVDGADRTAAALWAAAVVLLAALVEMAGHPAVLGPWSPIPPLLASWAFAGLSTVTPIRRRPAGSRWSRCGAAWARAGCWVFAGGWVAYGYRWGLTGRYWQVRGWRAETWHVQYWQVGGFAALVAVALSAVYAMPTDLGPLDAGGRPQPTAGGAPPLDVEWSQVVATATKGAVTAVHDVTVEPWETGHGETVRGRLPSGDTFDALKVCEARIASALRLPEGCTVTVLADGDADGFALEVMRADALAEDIPYPGTGGGG